jgi:hypothetical protein
MPPEAAAPAASLLFCLQKEKASFALFDFTKRDSFYPPLTFRKDRLDLRYD